MLELNEQVEIGTYVDPSSFSEPGHSLTLISCRSSEPDEPEMSMSCATDDIGMQTIVAHWSDVEPGIDRPDLGFWSA